MVYTPLRISGSQYQTLSIAAPSRAAKRSNGPLDGMRIAVKDMFEINGLTTTLCNRAFYEISRPSNSTAACVKRLIDAGVHVLGTTKISSMISREEPTEAIDYHPPFNPRADGYQSPAGSSSGSGAATAAYEWLDFTIAEDTSGSGRRPAAANGLFEYRPTHDLVDLSGMWPTFLQFDTPVIMSRDLNIIASVAPLWCSLGAALSPPKPLSILYPDDYLPTDNKEHLQHLDSFVEDLRSASDGTVTKFSIAQKWHDSCPQGCSPDIKEYLSDVIVQTFYHGFYHSQGSFRNKYYEIYQKQPFVNSFVKWRWDLGSKVTGDQHREGLHRLEVYKSWFLKEVMNGSGKHSVLVIPISEGKPNYRDRPPEKPTVQNGFESLFLSPILGCPDLVIPIAQMDYESKVSGRTERLPICVNVLGIPGGDPDLINVARNALQASGRPCAVRTGSEMF
jgi:Asp-tRNA(Asn)/Glu-tRNA(Gln) amidotransferase A subunit family amidase